VETPNMPDQDFLTRTM